MKENEIIMQSTDYVIDLAIMDFINLLRKEGQSLDGSLIIPERKLRKYYKKPYSLADREKTILSLQKQVAMLESNLKKANIGGEWVKVDQKGHDKLVELVQKVEKLQSNLWDRNYEIRDLTKFVEIVDSARLPEEKIKFLEDRITEEDIIVPFEFRGGELTQQSGVRAAQGSHEPQEVVQLDSLANKLTLDDPFLINEKIEEALDKEFPKGDKARGRALVLTAIAQIEIEEARKQGYDQGHKEGYEKGYLQGWQSCLERFTPERKTDIMEEASQRTAEEIRDWLIRHKLMKEDGGYDEIYKIKYLQSPSSSVVSTEHSFSKRKVVDSDADDTQSHGDSSGNMSTQAGSIPAFPSIKGCGKPIDDSGLCCGEIIGEERKYEDDDREYGFRVLCDECKKKGEA